MNTKAYTSCFPAQSRRALFAAALLGGFSATALGQAPGRSAYLLPPQPLAASEARTVARAAANDDPATDPYATTPVRRPAGGPSWLTGADVNVRPAASTDTPAGRGGVVNASLRTGTNDASATAAKPADGPSFFSRGFDKLRGAVSGKPTEAAKTPAKDTPTAHTPFQGVTPAGTPVLAGPPAYMWYGYGTTTPGLNPYSPTGQYPKASANWYSLTGATPGAFPIPVPGTPNVGPGVDPPSYRPQPLTRVTANPPEPYAHAPLATRTAVVPPPIPNAPTYPVRMPTLPQPVLPPAAPRFPMNPPVAATPAPDAAIMSPAALPAPRTFFPASTGVIAQSPPAMPAEVAPVAPPSLPVLAVTPINPASPPLVASPPAQQPLPTAPTDHPWQAAPDKFGTDGWAPSNDGSKQRSEAAPIEPTWESKSTTDLGAVVRAQAGEPVPAPDPVIAYVHGLLRGNANGVDVRWTGSRRLAVCFEVPSDKDGGRLVQAISAKKELAPFQIDFCVVVK